MRYAAGLLAAILMQVASLSAVWADGEKFPPIPDADEIIAYCRDTSQERRDTGVTTEMMYANDETIECLAAAIAENMRILVDEDYMKKEDGMGIEESIDAFATATGRLYKNIYNVNRACLGSCGTMWLTSGSNKVIDFQEILLKHIIMHRRERERW